LLISIQILNRAPDTIVIDIIVVTARTGGEPCRGNIAAWRLPAMRFDIGCLRLARDGRGFTRLEFGLLTAMLCAMIINGIASLGGGLGNGHKPIGNTEHKEQQAAAAPAPAPAQ
jgi:Flp pilus assembly pilin Flp